jgi:hypothetical protein
LQFILNSKNYVIKDSQTIFEAVDRLDNTQSKNHCVQFTAIERNVDDIKLGLYRVKAKIIKDEKDILIRPVCSALPVVQEIYPPFVPSGYAQDTTVKITFSKPMATETFGSFECIFITSENGSAKKYYGTPYFSNDNTVLNIPTAKGKFLIDPDKTGTMQISINIDTTNIRDIDNLSLPKDISYTYCVNQNKDGKIPFITAYELNTINDEQLDESDFSTWESTPQIFYQNHIKDTIKYAITGYDDESGVSSLKITETLYSLPNGTMVGESDQKPIDFYKEDAVFAGESQNHNYYKFTGCHTLQTLNDGIIKIDFQILDKSGNKSAAQTYFVIKDTQIDLSTLNFAEFDEVVKVECEDNTQNFTMTFKETPKDKFYNVYSSDYEIVMKWGYTEETITNDVQINDNCCTIIRDPNILTYVTITCTDTVGNQKTQLKLIPPRANFDLSCVKQIAKTQTVYGLQWTPTSYNSLYQNIAYHDAELSLYFYYKYSYNSIYTNLSKSDENFIGISRDWDYDIFPLYVIKHKDGSLVYSPVTNYYLSATGDYLYTKINGIRGLDPISQMDTIPSTPEFLYLSTEPVQGSGCYKIQIDTAQLDNEYTWTYKFYNSDTESTEAFVTDTFYLVSPATYTLTLEAKDSEGKIYTKTSQQIQTSDGQTHDQLTLEGDLTPPAWNFYRDNNFRVEPNGVHILSEPVDNESGIPVDPTDSNYRQISYCFLPNPGTHMTDFYSYSPKELEEYEDMIKSLKFKINTNDVFIPFMDIPEDFYTLCVIVKDNNENTGVECMPVLNKTLKKAPISNTIEQQQNSSKVWNLITTVESGEADNAVQTVFNYNTSKKKWEINLPEYKSGGRDSTISIQVHNGYTYPSDKKLKYFIGPKYADDVLVSETGFYDYTLIENPTTFSMWESINGYQISTAGIVVRTLYSEKKLTETNTIKDAQVWLLKGLETGTVVTTQNYNYTSNNWAEVPDGWYYTVIATDNGACGGFIMSEVKQK